VSHKDSLSRHASSATSLACAKTIHTRRKLATASCQLVLTRARWVWSFSEDLPKTDLTLTLMIVTQAWQARACQTPVRDVAPTTRGVNIALIVIAAIMVSIRFLSRWQGQGTNTLGWDDWTILASFLLLIPSTAILQISPFLVRSRSSLVVVLTFRS
jgi:hypothetical protein